MSKRAAVIGVFVLGVFMPAAGQAAPILFQAAGANAAAIQGTVDSFRAALGNPNNGNAAGPLAGGRREINWDGGGAATSAPAGTPFAGFQNIRGALFTTPGTGFIQATLAAGSTLSDAVGNPTYATTFSAFSALRVFAPLGSTITDTTFFIPGTLQAAGVSAFGAVFSDVDTFGPTRIELFDANNNLLLNQAVLAGTTANGSQSFLGVQFNAGELVARARIITGNAALGPNDNPGGGIDVVVMDDFIYSEPQAVPEPVTLTLVGIGLAAAAARRRSR